MQLLTHAAQRGFALGAKHGVVGGFRAFFTEEATPEMDETAMQGAIGIIIAVGGVLIALYIIAVVVGSISYSVTSGNIRLSPTWNTTITNHVVSRKETRKSFEMTNGRLYVGEYRFAGTGHIQPGKCSAYRHYRGGHSYDRHWGLQRSGYLSLALIPRSIVKSVEYCLGMVGSVLPPTNLFYSLPIIPVNLCKICF